MHVGNGNEGIQELLEAPEIEIAFSFDLLHHLNLGVWKMLKAIGIGND